MAMQVNSEIVVDFDVPAKMRDGVTLRANVYRPAGEGKWPVLLTRLPYGKDLPLGSAVMDPAQVARRGYVVIVQDTRGRWTSEGEWMPFVNEAHSTVSYRRMGLPPVLQQWQCGHVWYLLLWLHPMGLGGTPTSCPQNHDPCPDLE